MSKKRPTKKEREYMDRAAELGCMICFMPAEIHHIRSGQGIGQRAGIIGGVIPLCPMHHRTGGFGVAIHAGIKTWQKANGTEELLADITFKRIIQGGFNVG